MRCAYGKEHLAVVVERLREDVRSFLLDDAHDLVHQQVLEGDFYAGIHRLLYNLSGSYGLGSGGFVSLYESARAQFHAAEVADHDDEDVGQLVGVYLSEDGLACRAGGFAVIICPELLPLMAKHIGIAYMARIKVFLCVLIHKLLDLIYGRNRKSEGKELASLLRICARRGGSEGEEGVRRPTPLPLPCREGSRY